MTHDGNEMSTKTRHSKHKILYSPRSFHRALEQSPRYLSDRIHGALKGDVFLVLFFLTPDP
jgi:hypothetical protein